MQETTLNIDYIIASQRHKHTYLQNVKEKVHDIQIELNARLNVLVIVQFFQHSVRVKHDEASAGDSKDTY